MGLEHPLTAFLREYGSDGIPMPDIAYTYQGHKLLVCGDAACVWDDLERFGARSDRGVGRVEKAGWHIMTINKLVETLPGDIEHCFSNEPRLLHKFIAARRNEYADEFIGPKHIHSHNRGATWQWPFGGHGTSGLGGVLVGVGLGYDEIVICGMPLDGSAHNGEPSWRVCGFEREAADSGGSGINAHWKRARDLAFQGKVRSMSGRTRGWLEDPC